MLNHAVFFAYSSMRRKILMAVTPAPNPLLILTTLTPGAQDEIIACKVVIPYQKLI